MGGASSAPSTPSASAGENGVDSMCTHTHTHIPMYADTHTHIHIHTFQIYADVPSFHIIFVIQKGLCDKD